MSANFESVRERIFEELIRVNPPLKIRLGGDGDLTDESILDATHGIASELSLTLQREFQNAVQKAVQDVVRKIDIDSRECSKHGIGHLKSEISEIIQLELANTQKITREELKRIPDMVVQELKGGPTLRQNKSVIDICDNEVSKFRKNIMESIAQDLPKIRIDTENVVKDFQKTFLEQKEPFSNHNLRTVKEQMKEREPSQNIYETYIRDNHRGLRLGQWISIINNDKSSVQVYDTYQKAAIDRRKIQPRPTWFCQQYRGVDPASPYLMPIVFGNFNFPNLPPLLAFIKVKIFNPDDHTKVTDQIMMIDTGSEFCVGELDTLVGRLRLIADAGSPQPGIGVGGPTTFAEVEADIQFENYAKIPIKIGCPIPKLQGPVKWILGQNFLRDYKHQWDLPENMPNVQIIMPDETQSTSSENVGDADYSAATSPSPMIDNILTSEPNPNIGGHESEVAQSVRVSEILRAEQIEPLQVRTDSNIGDHELDVAQSAMLESSDKQIVLAGIQEDGGRTLKYTSPELRRDPEMVLAAVQQSGRALQYASPEMRKNKEIVLAAVQQDGLALEYASLELKNDKDIVLTAVVQDGRALEHASPELRRNPEIVIAAVVQDGLALQFASSELRNDKDLISFAGRDNDVSESPSRDIFPRSRVSKREPNMLRRILQLESKYERVICRIDRLEYNEISRPQSIRDRVDIDSLLFNVIRFRSQFEAYVETHPNLTNGHWISIVDGDYTTAREFNTELAAARHCGSYQYWHCAQYKKGSESPSNLLMHKQEPPPYKI